MDGKALLDLTSMSSRFFASSDRYFLKNILPIIIFSFLNEINDRMINETLDWT